MEKEITYTMDLQDWAVTGNGNIREVMSRELNLSRKEISRLKFDGEILLNGQRTKVNDRMRVGDTLTLKFPELSREKVPEMDAEPEILFEDEDMVVVNKPAGIPCHPVHKHLDDSMGTILASHYQKQGYDFIIRPVGRLDKDVSGAIIYAKNRLAAARLSKDREEGKLRKYYTAFVMGVLEAKRGVIDEPIAKVDGKIQRVSGEESGKPAQTYYQVTHEFHIGEESISVLAVEIETGRTHQIRSHMASIGHPLLGDELYGGDMRFLKRPALHCAEIIFLTPFARSEMEVNAPLPQDLRRLLEHPDEIELPEEEETAAEVETEKVQNETESSGSSGADAILAGLKHTSELSEIDEPAVMEEKPRRRMRVIPVLIICAVLLVALIAGIVAFSRYQTIRSKNEEQELYNTLVIEFKNDATVEYGGDFHPEDYVESAPGELSVEGTIDTKKTGEQEITYTLTSKTSDGTEVSRSFVKAFQVKDEIGPIIILKEQEVSLKMNETYDPEDNIESVKDPVDGKVSYTVDDGNFTTEKSGMYTITVSAKDKNGNQTKETFRIVVSSETGTAPAASASPSPLASPSPSPVAQSSDTKEPVITLTSSSLALTQGESFSAGSLIYSVTDETDGALNYTEALTAGTYTIVSNVDSNTPGEYQVTVTAVDKAGNRSSQSVTVTVNEKPAETAKTTVSTSGTAKDIIYNFLTAGMGFNKAQACGILANMHRESRFNPAADNGLGYYGICQWGYERKDSLISWCEENNYDYTTLDGQLHFLQYEMPLFYPNTTAQLRACPDTEEGARKACWIFAIGYEVAGEEYANMSQDKAAEYFNS